MGALRVFDAELQRTPVPDAPPSSMGQTVESPLFNGCASADSSSAMTVVALPMLPTGNATDARRTRCGARGDCMAVVRGQTTLQLDFFCVPDPALIAATVFPMVSTLKKTLKWSKIMLPCPDDRL